MSEANRQVGVTAGSAVHVDLKNLLEEVAKYQGELSQGERWLCHMIVHDVTARDVREAKDERRMCLNRPVCGLYPYWKVNVRRPKWSGPRRRGVRRWPRDD